jgi:membrane protein YqaA with SNARE-associated domain
MRIFSWMYDRVLRWSRHPHAPGYLAAMSFAESSFFPVPPDVMLAPMVLAKRTSAWYFASITTAASVLGGMFGYAIGVFLYHELAVPVIQFYDAAETFARLQEWFTRYGFWVVFLAGFSPIPYKLFTIGAGVASMAFLPFVIASAVGRGARFFLVAGLVFWGGERMANALKSRIDLIGWSVVALGVITYLVFGR